MLYQVNGLGGAGLCKCGLVWTKMDTFMQNSMTIYINIGSVLKAGL